MPLTTCVTPHATAPAVVGALTSATAAPVLWRYPRHPVAWAVALVVTGVSIAVGILAPEVGDVDALMGGTLVWAAVAAVVIALDLVLVAGLDAVLGDGSTNAT
jgi:hypothetical protein